MTRFLLAGLLIVGVAFGVGVNADTPEQSANEESQRESNPQIETANRTNPFGAFNDADVPEEVVKQKERQRHKRHYLQMAVRLADEWPLERLQEETERLGSELAQADDQETRVRVIPVEEVEEAVEGGPRPRQQERDLVEEANERNRRRAQRLPHGLQGTYLITGDGEHSIVVIVDPTVVEIESRSFLYGKVSDDNKLVRVPEQLAGGAVYMPLDRVRLIQQVMK